MHIHPMVVHFPIALVILSMGYYVLALLPVKNILGLTFIKKHVHEIGLATLLVGALSAMAALASGYLFTNEMKGIMGMVRQEHLNFAIASTVMAVVSALMWWFYYAMSVKRKLFFYVTGVCLLITVALIGYTGHIGGQMVFGF